MFAVAMRPSRSHGRSALRLLRRRLRLPLRVRAHLLDRGRRRARRPLGHRRAAGPGRAGRLRRSARPGRDRRLFPRPHRRPLGRRRTLALPARGRQTRRARCSWRPPPWPCSSWPSASWPPRPPLPPAAWINQESFLSTFGFPVQLLCMALAVPFVVGLWLHYRALLREEHPGLVDRRGTFYEVAMLGALAAILVVGFYATSARRRPLGRPRPRRPSRCAPPSPPRPSIPTRSRPRPRRPPTWAPPTTATSRAADPHEERKQGHPLVLPHGAAGAATSSSPSTASRSTIPDTQVPAVVYEEPLRQSSWTSSPERTSPSGRIPMSSGRSSPASSPSATHEDGAWWACWGWTSTPPVGCRCWPLARASPILVTLLLCLMRHLRLRRPGAPAPRRSDDR